MGAPAEYARAAAEAGLTEIGFSDHNPMPGPFDDWRMDLDDFSRYLELVDEARASVPEVTVRLGLEIDFLEGRESWAEETAGMAEFDYLIGSVHYIAPGWAIDDPALRDRISESNVDEIWARYFELYEKMVRSRLFDIHAHPDLPKKYGLRPRDPGRFFEPVIAALAETGAAYEISTAGRHKPCAEFYPAREFVAAACESGVPIVISSDAHHPDHVGRDFAEAVELAKDCGYQSALRFENREAFPVAI